jgi:paraquat-inducible protein B
MSQILETIIEFITSEKVAYVISLIGALYIPVQGIVSKITNKKLNKKIQNKQTLLQIVKDEYQKYATNAEVIVNNLSTKYIEAEKTIEKITDILKKQSEAMTIAFNNSNLNASAKKLVEETLKIVEDAANNIIDGSITEDENKKDGQIPISNAVKEVVEEKENEKREIKRIK